MNVSFAFLLILLSRGVLGAYVTVLDAYANSTGVHSHRENQIRDNGCFGLNDPQIALICGARRSAVFA
jgi:hypothetical protein